MEEILKIYNDGSHFVGTRFTRSGFGTVECKNQDGSTSEITYVKKENLKRGYSYDAKEFISENHVLKADKKFKKHQTLKDYEDYIKELLSKYSLTDFSYDLIKELVKSDFVKRFDDIIFYSERGCPRCRDSISFVEETLKKLGKNLKERVKRFRQKAFNNKWNYFVTLTYDDSIHDEESFKTKIKKKLSNLHTRNGWLYMGVFERSSVGRLHFHGLFYVPDGEMIGSLDEVSDYSTEHHKRQTRIENTVFKKQFGINDFKSLGKEDLTKGNVLNYILKYIGKTGEPIFYSRGIKTFIYIKLNDPNDFVLKFVNYIATRYVLFDDCLDNSIEINVKRMNC